MRSVGVLFTAFAFVALGLVDPALAQDAASGAILDNKGLAAIGIAIAVFGGALGQSKAISSALESIGRNPGAAGQMFLPWLLALAFIESLVIFALLIALKVAGFF